MMCTLALLRRILGNCARYEPQLVMRRTSTHVVEDILVDHVVELRSKLDARWSTAADDKAQQLLPLFLIDARHRCPLQVLHYPPSNRLRIRYRLQLIAVLQPRHAMRIGGRSASDDGFVVRKVDVRLTTGLSDFDQAVFDVEVDALGLDVVTVDASDDLAKGFDERAHLDRADRRRGCERMLAKKGMSVNEEWLTKERCEEGVLRECEDEAGKVRRSAHWKAIRRQRGSHPG